MKQLESADFKGAEQFGIFGVIGIINIRKENFLAVVTDRDLVGSVKEGCEIFEVTGVRLEPFNPANAASNP